MISLSLSCAATLDTKDIIGSRQQVKQINRRKAYEFPAVENWLPQPYSMGQKLGLEKNALAELYGTERMIEYLANLDMAMRE